MEKMITRTLRTTTVYASAVTKVNGKLHTTDYPPFTVDSEINESAAIKECKKRYGKENQYVVDLDIHEATYGMSVTDFKIHAKLIDKTDDEGITDDYLPDEN